jgi:hypothetical protein
MMKIFQGKKPAIAMDVPQQLELFWQSSCHPERVCHAEERSIRRKA